MIPSAARDLTASCCHFLIWDAAAILPHTLLLTVARSYCCQLYCDSRKRSKKKRWCCLASVCIKSWRVLTEDSQVHGCCLLDTIAAHSCNGVLCRSPHLLAWFVIGIYGAVYLLYRRKANIASSQVPIVQACMARMLARVNLVLYAQVCP